MSETKQSVKSVKINVREECRPLPFVLRRTQLPKSKPVPKSPKPPEKNPG